MGTGTVNAGGNPVYHHIKGGVEILLVTSCCRSWDKLSSDVSLGSYEDLPYLVTFFMVLQVSLLSENYRFKTTFDQDLQNQHEPGCGIF